MNASQFSSLTLLGWWNHFVQFHIQYHILNRLGYLVYKLQVYNNQQS